MHCNRNLIKSINTWAVPLYRCKIFGTILEIEELEGKKVDDDAQRLMPKR